MRTPLKYYYSSFHNSSNTMIPWIRKFICAVQKYEEAFLPCTCNATYSENKHILKETGSFEGMGLVTKVCPHVDKLPGQTFVTGLRYLGISCEDHPKCSVTCLISRESALNHAIQEVRVPKPQAFNVEGAWTGTRGTIHK